MRAGLSTIQQTLTPEAATILTHSISEATRRNHGQTTPLHVAATLLSSTSGYLRQACIRSHPNSSHPLQCRALELCFSVALERLPTAQNLGAPGFEPPISNALMAALKRAQAHQRRGCPEQQQQPLLAVKVELDQVIVSILDDPSVSRVMREAGFSSPAVKAVIESSINGTSSGSNVNVNFGGGFGGNVFLNPKLQRGGDQKGDEVKKVLEIMLRSKKRNPVLVGDLEPEGVVREFLQKVENKEFDKDGILKNVEVISLDKGVLSDKDRIPDMIKGLVGVIESRIGSNGGVIVNLGDLKWLVEQIVGVQQGINETGWVAVVEMAKLVGRFGNKMWLIGTATCETYLRCQVYHSNMESDWDLQAVPMASKSPLPGIFPRLGTERRLSNLVEPLNPLDANPISLPALTRRPSENSGPTRKTPFCPQCSENYEKELTKLTAIEKSFSKPKQDANRPSLPQWLQNAKTKDQSQGKTLELQRKWRDTCLNLHPNFHQNNRPGPPGPPALSMTSLYNSNFLTRPSFQPKMLTTKLQLHTNQDTVLQAHGTTSPPGSPVRTDLVLGRKETEKLTSPEKVSDEHAKDFSSCISSKLLNKFANALDVDTYKKLLKGLMEKAWWQAEAASEVASAITRCRLGNGKRRGGGSRGDIWLLFTGPDRVGKKKMALELAEQICGASPITICLGPRRGDEEVHTSFRGKTFIDRIAEAVRQNPFSVILLEDIDEADLLVRGSVKRAIERGRIGDSHGREVGLGNSIFVLTGDWSTTSPPLKDGHFVDENRLASIASGNWELGLVVREKSTKRRRNWLHNESRPLRPKRESGPGFLDLNLALGSIDDDKTEGSHNSSDVTIDHEDDHLGLVNGLFSVTSVPHELVNSVDNSIVFKPVDSAFVRGEIKKTISLKFSMVVEDDLSIEIEDDVLEKILGGLWHDPTSLQEWVEKVVGPSFDQLKPQLPLGDKSSLVVRLVVESGSGSGGKSNGNGDWLPSSILV